MEKIIKYSGITALSFLMVMMSLGPITQNAYGQGAIASTLIVDIGCGAAVANAAIAWIGPVVAGTVLNSQTIGQFAGPSPTLTNNGAAQSVITASSGNLVGGGYVGFVDGLTHIPPAQMQWGMVNAATLVFMDNTNAPQGIGTIPPNDFDTLLHTVDTTLFGASTTDNDWRNTTDIFVSCTIV